jgi:3-oxo-5-alpha-steroid 4-dehydrogenase 3
MWAIFFQYVPWLSLDLAVSVFWVAMLLSIFAAAFVPSLRSFTDHGKLSGGQRKAPLTVSKDYFAHFYMFGSVFNLLMLRTAIDKLSSEDRTLDSIVVHVLMQLQMCRRLYETLYVNRTGGGTMHLLAYVFSFCFYTAAILSLSVVSPYSGSEQQGVLSWRHALGCMLFSLGSLHQFRCHKILAALRKDKGQHCGGDKAQYFVPKG